MGEIIGINGSEKKSDHSISNDKGCFFLSPQVNVIIKRLTNDTLLVTLLFTDRYQL